MNNEKIKEAFDAWLNSEPSKEEKEFNQRTEYRGDAFYAGYTSRDAEIEQLKKDKQELIESLDYKAVFQTGYTAADREWRERVEKLREYTFAHGYAVLKEIDQILG